MSTSGIPTSGLEGVSIASPPVVPLYIDPPDPPSVRDPGHLAIAEARMHLGFQEGKGHKNPFSAYFKRPAEDWCADFVSYCFEKSGNPLGTRGKGFARVEEIVDWFHGHGHHWDKQPAIGAVVAFDIPWTFHKYDHIGIITGYTKDKITYISGNTEDKHGHKGVVDEHDVPRDSQIIGYGHW